MNASTQTPSEPVALDASLLWQDDVLAFRHLARTGAVVAGDAVGGLGPIPRDAFTFARLDRGIARVTIPDGAIATVRRADDRREIIAGPAEARLSLGDTVALPLGALVLRAVAVAPIPLALDAPRGPRAGGALVHVAVAAAVHLAVLGLSLHAALARGPDEDEARADTIRGLLVSAENSERERDHASAPDRGEGPAQGATKSARPGDGRAGGGQRAAGNEGKMGDAAAGSAKPGRYAVPERIKRDDSPSLAREEALRDAAKFGMIGLLGQGPAAPVAPWSSDPEAHGADSIATRGAMWARDLGSYDGAGGLGLTGVGEGGGGRGEGIGLGEIGTLGHLASPSGYGTGGDGVRAGGGGAWGGSRARLGGSHRTKTWGRWGDWSRDSGRLPPEAIRRIIRQNFGRFRSCYESGLHANQTLAGRVTVRFVIGRDGSVSSVEDGGSDLGDPAVVSCVVRAFYGLSFPQPEGGIVMVTYPLVFESSGVDATPLVFSSGR
jgi:hypothetical protein